MKRSIAVLVLSALALPAAAQTPPQAVSQSQPPPAPGAPVVVTGGPSPVLTSSYPADGASAPGGVLVLKTVFDQDMTPDAWSYGPVEGTAFPACLGRPRLLADKRTFALLCTAEANTSYAVQINPAPDFANAGGRSAKPAVLHFTTTDIGPRDMHEALTQAGLTDTDEPLMNWTEAGQDAVQAEPAATPASPTPAPPALVKP
jgi:hypothetical protein